MAFCSDNWLVWVSNNDEIRCSKENWPVDQKKVDIYFPLPTDVPEPMISALRLYDYRAGKGIRRPFVPVKDVGRLLWINLLDWHAQFL